jgi:ATP-dependent protease ClpP protease subunit
MSYYIPQWEERTSYGFRRIDPYAKLFEDRIIFVGTPISDDVANAVMAQLLCLQQMDPDRDRWFTAPQAVEYGLVDKVVTNAREAADEGRPARNKD